MAGVRAAMRVTMKRRLGPYLEEAYRAYARPELIESDPLQLPYRYESVADREVVAFIAAGLSFGSVASILRSAEVALSQLGPSPAQRLQEMSAKERRACTRGFNHRWIFADDLEALFQMLGAALRERGGLEPLFAEGMEEGALDVRPGLSSLVGALEGYLTKSQRGRRGTRYFLSSPTGPGAAKRLHMFTRWMVRSGDVDLGLWSSAKPSQLIIPLDTHVGQVARILKLTKRKSPGLGMALEITENLRRIDPEDPVRFDFAISRLGILGKCPHRRVIYRCKECAPFPLRS